ncbi:MAG: B12-binding domain-containing radical SAM protein [Desulfobacterales bacterium]|nr:B12-binding domain-containing radical SAM protein [Desulfobacterales bacterium]
MTLSDPHLALCILPPFWPDLPPLSLAYLQGFLLAHHIPVTAIDYNQQFYQAFPTTVQNLFRKSIHPFLEDQMIEIMQTHAKTVYQRMIKNLLSYSIIGFSCYRSNFKATLSIASMIKEKKSDIKIILGGPEIANQYFIHKQNLKQKWANTVDLLVAGEGERPLYEYLHHPQENDTPSLVTFKQYETLAPYPTPEFTLAPELHYPRTSTRSLLFSRGCIRKCRFCSERLLYRGFRHYPIQQIISQLQRDYDQGMSHFIFHDSMLNADINALDQLLSAIIQEMKPITWEAQMGIRTDMPDELYRKIKQSGCRHLFIGLESGSDVTLAAMHKGYSTSDAIHFFKQLKSQDISFGVSMIIGYPSESESDFQESLEFILNNKEYIPKIEQVNPFVYYQGTPLSKKADYRSHPQSVQRTEYFIQKIKEAKIKYTRHYLWNLIEDGPLKVEGSS